MTSLGRHIRAARRSYYQRVADCLEAELEALDHDPEVTAEGDFVCFAGRRLRLPLAADLVRKYYAKVPVEG
jgi:hypothetical protein